MSQETRKRCLEPFFTTKGERGTGLGLAMVHGILQRHHADIDIESELGKGTAIDIFWRFILLVFPVMVTMRVYRLLKSARELEWQNSLVEALNHPQRLGDSSRQPRRQ